jgi:quercetin dioxygenase-like cupin family protein/DNA-binding XRE family transcriptional regulator
MDDTLRKNLGQRLRHLREETGRGLREQARDIGISASSLSALENNTGGVSLQRLQQVANHFGLQITDLLAVPDDDSSENGQPSRPEVVRQWGTTVAGVERGDGVLYQLLGHGHNHQIQPYLISFQPGASYRNDPIAHAGEEFAFVLIGRVELLLGDQSYVLSQGDAIRFSTETPHAFRNASDLGVAVLIGAATPPW